MLMNNRNPGKDEENDFGKRPKVATEIYELCRLLSETQKTMDDSSCENISEITLKEPPNVHQFSKQKIHKFSPLEKNESLISASTIPFDNKRHTNSPVSLHSELLFGNCHSNDTNSDSSLHFESNANEDERLLRHKELLRPTVHDLLNDKSSVVVMESNVKTIPVISVSHSQFEAQITAKLNPRKNQLPTEVNPANNINIICNANLRKDQFSPNLNLQSEASESSNRMQTPIINSSTNLNGLNKLLHQSHFYTEKQKPFSFNYKGAPNTVFRKDNNLCQNFVYDADKLTKQYEGLKPKWDRTFHSTQTESKFLAFNFSLDLANQRKLKDSDRNLNQKNVSRGQSEPSNAGFLSKADKNCLFVQTTWYGRKCKSEVHIFQETKSIPEVKFLASKRIKDSQLDSKSGSLRKLTKREESSKLKRIPTFRGHKLPAKVSVLLLNGPIRLNYTENISGKSQEILMCTSDVIEDVIRSEKGIQQQDIVKRILAKSRPYIGKPVHVIFEPTKATALAVDFPSTFDSVEGSPVPLHPSPAKHNLLAKQPEVVDYQGNDETDADMALCSNWENSSDETLVVKQNDQLMPIENRMPQTDSSGLDTSAKQNNRLETPSCNRSVEPQGKKKLRIRLCRRKKSRTALKRVNVKQIVNSVFRNFFHFYSVFGGHLKSGSVITKSNSILWLRDAGVATDDRSLEIANQLFRDIAGAKVVLNIFDYMQFLIMFARRQRMATVDLIAQLTICEIPLTSNIQHRQSSESRRLKNLPQSRNSEQGGTGIIYAHRSQSVPNLRTAPPVFCS